jgi:hypothetical protein
VVETVLYGGERVENSGSETLKIVCAGAF